MNGNVNRNALCTICKSSISSSNITCDKCRQKIHRISQKKKKTQEEEIIIPVPTSEFLSEEDDEEIDNILFTNIKY